MKQPGAGLRITSSIFSGILLGMITTVVGLALSIMLSTSGTEEALDSGIGTNTLVAVSFLAGLLLMWALHKAYHHTIVLYILLLVGGIPLTLISVVITLASYGSLDSMSATEASDDGIGNTGIGGVMMLITMWLSLITTAAGLLASLSAILGLIAHNVRAKALRAIS